MNGGGGERSDMWNHAAGVAATSNGIKVDRDMGGEGGEGRGRL